jgi:hypothetical protein
MGFSEQSLCASLLYFVYITLGSNYTIQTSEPPSNACDANLDLSDALAINCTYVLVSNIEWSASFSNVLCTTLTWNLTNTLINLIYHC